MHGDGVHAGCMQDRKRADSAFIVHSRSPMLLLNRAALVALLTRFSDDSDKASADVALLHGCLQSCMPNNVAGLLVVYEDMVEVLLVLEIFLKEDS